MSDSSAAFVSPSHPFPSTRTFELPLPPEQDQSHLRAGGAHTHATVSHAANSSRAAQRAAAQQREAQEKRRARSPPHSPQQSLGGSHAAEHAVSAAAGGVAMSVAPTATVSALLAAAAVSSSPNTRTGGQDRRRSRGSFSVADGAANVSPLAAADSDFEATFSPSPVTMQADEHDAMLSELSEAMRADLAMERAAGNLPFFPAEPPRIGSARTNEEQKGAGSAAAAAPPKRMPALPAAQLKSLVRSHVRHVGLSSRLKTRLHARELREAQTERREKSMLTATKEHYLLPRAAAAKRKATITAAAAKPRKKDNAAASAAHASPAANMLSKLGLDASHAHLLPVTLLQGSTRQQASVAQQPKQQPSPQPQRPAPAAALQMSDHSPPVPALGHLTSRYGALAATRLVEEDGAEDEDEGRGEQQQQWRDQHGQALGVESSTHSYGGGSGTRLPPLIPLQQLAHGSPSAASPADVGVRMPPLRVSPVSARALAHLRKSRLLQGSFVPSQLMADDADDLGRPY